MNDQTYKDIDRAFKALEERDELLDKIRAEIESKEMVETTSERVFYNMALNDVLQIIDKHKGWVRKYEQREADTGI